MADRYRLTGHEDDPTSRTRTLRTTLTMIIEVIGMKTLVFSPSIRTSPGRLPNQVKAPGKYRTGAAQKEESPQRHDEIAGAHESRYGGCSESRRPGLPLSGVQNQHRHRRVPQDEFHFRTEEQSLCA